MDKTLGDLWREQPELFKSRHQSFPFIISLVAPVEDLSIQIHPNDAYARSKGLSSGKNEAWVFLEAPAEGCIVYGQNEKDAARLRAAIKGEKWSELIGHLEVHKGDFVYVPAGMLHALKRGCIAYEIQQATDVTYRFFDYHRKDDQGVERPLHLEDAIGCVDFTLEAWEATPKAQVITTPNATVTTYIQNKYFCVRRFDFCGEQRLTFPDYQLMTVIEGEGNVNEHRIQKGDNFLVPAGEALKVTGCVSIMATGE